MAQKRAPSADDLQQKEAAALAQVRERLRLQFPELSDEQIEAAVNGRYHEFDGSPIRDFVAVLVERQTREDLKRGNAEPDEPQP